jgi:hypothetical protein
LFTKVNWFGTGEKSPSLWEIKKPIDILSAFNVAGAALQSSYCSVLLFFL